MSKSLHNFRLTVHVRESGVQYLPDVGGRLPVTLEIGTQALQK